VHPNLSEWNKFVAGKQVWEKLFSPMVKKGLKFFFGFKGRTCSLESDAMEQEERS
jgi:hypothetical protein